MIPPQVCGFQPFSLRYRETEIFMPQAECSRNGLESRQMDSSSLLEQNRPASRQPKQEQERTGRDRGRDRDRGRGRGRAEAETQTEAEAETETETEAETETETETEAEAEAGAGSNQRRSGSRVLSKQLATILTASNGQTVSKPLRAWAFTANLFLYSWMVWQNTIKCGDDVSA